MYGFIKVINKYVIFCYNKSTVKEKIQNKIRKIIKLTDKICKKHKECDRENVYHTLLCLEQKPLERLEMSIRRANLSVYSRRV